MGSHNEGVSGLVRATVGCLKCKTQFPAGVLGSDFICPDCEDGPGMTKTELMEKKKKELVAMANELGIVIPKKATKAILADLILEIL